MTTPTSSPASDFSVALLHEFVRLGVRDVVLSPGSRSQALALAAAEFERAGLLRLRVRIDERVAGFVALGLAVETATPVLIIMTSGTAVANLHPAVLEAYHSTVPLIVISADRPAELRGIASNQTTTQPGIFGMAAVVMDVEAPTADTTADDAGRVAREAISASRGPVHLNVQFREPLSSSLEPLVEQRPLVESVETPGPTTAPLHLAPAPGTLVVAGHAAGPQAEAVARALGAPLAAEVSSGAHFGPNLVVDYRTLLNSTDFGGRVERVIVFGHPTLTREVPALIQRAGVESIVVTGGTVEPYNPGHAVTTFAEEVVGDGAPDDSREARAWLGSWVTTSRNALEQHDAPPIEIALSNEPRDQAAFNRAVIAGLRAPVTRRALVEAVWRVTWPHDRLVLGASRLIREADRFVPGKRIPVHANRGLAGIDGTIGTGIGIALAAQAREGAPSAGVTRVLVGDLTMLHDVGSMLFGVAEPRPRIQVIVGNDEGGTIFEGLEVAGTTDAAPFERVMLTPQRVSFAALAEAYGWEYRRAATRGDLDAMLGAGDGPTLIEVPLAR